MSSCFKRPCPRGTAQAQELNLIKSHILYTKHVPLRFLHLEIFSMDVKFGLIQFENKRYRYIIPIEVSELKMKYQILKYHHILRYMQYGFILLNQNIQFECKQFEHLQFEII